jgi:hypothetical protein
MANPNVNCLEGMRCPNPNCGSYGPFRIDASVTVTVTDEGTEDDGSDYEWNRDSFCHCPECGQPGTIKTFTEEEESNNAEGDLNRAADIADHEIVSRWLRTQREKS